MHNEGEHKCRGCDATTNIRARRPYGWTLSGGITPYYCDDCWAYWADYARDLRKDDEAMARIAEQSGRD